MTMNRFQKQFFIPFLFILFFSFTGKAQSFFEQSLLPIPTGPFAVGTKSISLTDTNRKEKYLHNRTYRRVHIDIWFPAEKPVNQATVQYLDGFSSELIHSIFQSKGIRKSLLDSIKQTPTFSYLNAEISGKQNEFPVLIFSPGFYFGMAPLYSAFMENLASNGYIVCSISHPYEQPFIQFTDNETAFLKKKKSQLTYGQLWLAYKLQFRKPSTPEITEKITRNYLRKLKRFDRMTDLWMEDTRFVLDYFFLEKQNENSDALISKMNLNQIGTFGQSFGGAVAGQQCLRDSRIKAGINLDGFQFGDLIDQPLQKPFMLIQSGYNDMWNLGNSVIFGHHFNDFYFLDIPKARHFVFSDAALLPDIPPANKLDMIGSIDGRETLNFLNLFILEFFDVYLKDTNPKLLKASSGFPDAQLEVYRKEK
ncbi:MAG TPA: hypothetical protein DCG69_07300 [Bacteroidales bacterium]|nr:hypothetical protein [Bacteroidales bacterium]